MLIQLVNLLSEKDLSLSELADNLSIKQPELNQLFTELDNKGISINIDNQGMVKLPRKLSPLSSEVIQSVLGFENSLKVNIDCQLIIDSTNRQLLQTLPDNEKLCICSAEWQAKGRGRMERPWISPIGQNLLFSMARRWQKSEPLIANGILEILSIMSGVAVASALKGLGLDNVKLKWPNDIVVKNSFNHLEKIAGILVESKTDSQQGTWVVGIGLNVSDVRSWHTRVDQKITSLDQLTFGDYSREVIVAGIIENWLNLEQILLTKGVAEIVNQWKAFDVLLGEVVTIYPNTGENYLATARGIDEHGLLKVEPIAESKQDLILVHSGEVKVRIKHESTG